MTKYAFVTIDKEVPPYRAIIKDSLIKLNCSVKEFPFLGVFYISYTEEENNITIYSSIKRMNGVIDIRNVNKIEN